MLLLLFVLMLMIVIYRMVRATRRMFPPLEPLTNKRVGAHELKNGDLLLFEGAHLDAALVRCWSDSCFSHVGLVWESFVYNSDVDDFHMCALCGKNKSDGGVQLNDLLLKIGLYRGRVYRVPLRRELTTKQLQHWREQIMPRYCHTKFRHSTLEMLHTAFPDIVPLLNADTNSRMLCTELVALVYRELGLVEWCAGQQSPERLFHYLCRQDVLDHECLALVDRPDLTSETH